MFKGANFGWMVFREWLLITAFFGMAIGLPVFSTVMALMTDNTWWLLGLLPFVFVLAG